MTDLDTHEAPDAPLRVATALRYRDGMAAPVVVAKGRGLVAEQIVRRAEEAGVAIHVSDNLAAMLMQVEIDRAIPPQLFHAVAQLLAWLYRLEGRAAPVGSRPASTA
jgi:flagellar biosynthesis protein